ncbi:TetR/AcrR family transcriptional regulator [Pseudonocardia spinosispora]|uniref:TetR/AcrR family transcriptional regulator n=1 Tax=Pseudonocardia spinosispora TaxID=103441 RepID=UPI0003F73842|nr:TetR/AcrR family transcriptional regulator [Pseudonocardia spinosispora]
MTTTSPYPCAGDDGAADDDHRRRPRRRGEELNEAIYQATIDELAEVGWTDLTMDRIATRAKASKGSLYRRWPSRTELVIDAMRSRQPSYPTPESGDLRTDLLTLLHTIAEHLEGPRGEAMRGLHAEVTRSPELMRTLRTELTDATQPPMMEVLRRGVVRQEVRPGALTPLVAKVGPSLIRQQFLAFGAPIDRQYIEDVVDQVVLPLVIAH